MSQPAAKQSQLERIPESQWVKVNPTLMRYWVGDWQARAQQQVERKERSGSGRR